MTTTIIGLIVLLVGIIGLELSGKWMIQLGERNLRPAYKTIGKVLCWIGLFILIVGTIGFLFAISR